MCVSCGCGQLEDLQNDPRHIALRHLDQAAQAAEITREQVVQHILHQAEKEMRYLLRSTY